MPSPSDVFSGKILLLWQWPKERVLLASLPLFLWCRSVCQQITISPPSLVAKPPGVRLHFLRMPCDSRKWYSVSKKIVTSFHEKMWSWYVVVKWGICLRKQSAFRKCLPCGMKKKHLAFYCIPSSLVQFCLHLCARLQFLGGCVLFFQLSLYWVQSQCWSSNFSCERCSNFLNSYCSKDVSIRLTLQ